MSDYELRLKLEEARRRIADYIDAQINDSAYRADVVAQLPMNAPAGKFLVTAGDPNVYVGTGPSTPLRKIPTQPV